MARGVAFRSIIIAAAMAATTSPLWAAPQSQGGTTEAAGSKRVERASALYERGKAAHERGDFDRAAGAFAQADALVPDSTALGAALVAALKTDNAALGMELAGRTARDPFNEKLVALAEKARARFAGGAGRIVVHCDSCDVRIDGEKTQRGVATWVAAGEHEVLIGVAGRAEHRLVVVEPAAVVTLLPLGSPSPDQPLEQDPAPRSSEDSATGGSPAWFWTSLALTAAVGAGAIASGVDTAQKHDEFAEAPTDKGAVEGQTAETRTNALLGVTAGLGLITAAVGIFAVDWSGGDATAALLIDRDQLGASIGGRF